jgi:hypothetical protein
MARTLLLENCKLLVNNNLYIESDFINLHISNIMKTKIEISLLRKAVRNILLIAIITLVVTSLGGVSVKAQSHMLSGIELITNGDFENDTVGITSDYHFSRNNLKPEGYWSILMNPWDVFYQFSHCSDHTTGSGYMMCINGHYEPGKVVWQQSISNINPNTTYFFSMWFTSINPNSPPNLSVIINYAEVSGSPIQLSADTCSWQNFNCDWNSGNATSAIIQIIDNNLFEVGNDFVLDDISLMPYCTVNADAGDDVSICYGEQIVVGNEASGGFPPYKYEWLQNPGIIVTNEYRATVSNQQSGKYVLKVTDEIGCIDYDTVNVTVVPEISFEINSSVQLPACPCDTVVLSGPDGYNYLWSTGETTQEIIAEQSGEYSLVCSTDEGCSAEDELYVELGTAEFFLEIEEVEAESGQSIEIPIDLYRSISNPRCNFDDIFLRLKYNKTLLLPKLSDEFVVYTEDEMQIIEYSGKFDDLERSLSFVATLGNSSCTDIIIDDFNVGCDNLKMNLTNGKFCCSNICLDPTPRLFDDTGELFLAQNTPNPASGITNIQFGLIETGNTRISLVNIIGQKTDIIVNSSYEPGKYNIDYDVSKLPPGTYFIILETPSQSITRRLDIVR